ncbi:MAG TPA: hypothetical protein VE130_11520 [Nitrososphaeraceae archaeon]|nr:hypothetical protein [Nitrososphaeraceae archaeon]
MPFTPIKGHFSPKAGILGGVPVRFRADDPSFWLKLKGRPVEMNFQNPTVLTRFEGICQGMWDWR